MYEPGSVFKLITCAAALDTGAVTRNSRFVGAGKINVAVTKFRCANGHIHGSETPVSYTHLVQKSGHKAGQAATKAFLHDSGAFFLLNLGLFDQCRYLSLIHI